LEFGEKFFLDFNLIIAIYLGYIILSANITIVIALKALFHPTGIVIELVLVYMAILYYPNIDYGIGHF
jgi:hypothetical protein